MLDVTPDLLLLHTLLMECFHFLNVLNLNYVQIFQKYTFNLKY